MYHGRYQNSGKRHRKPARRRKLNKYFLVTLSLFLLLGAAGGVTLAYLIDESDSVTKSFTPAVVACSVDDDYKVTNDGNIDAYIRAAVVVNWGNDAGDINGIAPVAGTNYTITAGTDWTQGTDGYYYYTEKVPPTGNDETTTPVVTVSNVTGVPDGFALVVEVLAEAIQADGMGAASAQDAWAKAADGN